MSGEDSKRQRISVEISEPMVELKQSMDALLDGAKEPAQWPFIRRRLDRFFSGGPGGIFSDRFFESLPA